MYTYFIYADAPGMTHFSQGCVHRVVADEHLADGGAALRRLHHGADGCAGAQR
jgi:hypothetical protein